MSSQDKSTVVELAETKRDWLKKNYAVRELAGIPGMPGTTRGVRLWISRNLIPVETDGGEYRVPFIQLPSETQHVLTKLATEAVRPLVEAKFPPVKQPPPNRKKVTDLKDWQRKCMTARLAILNEIKRIADVTGQEKAIKAVIDAAKAGKLRPEIQSLVPWANAKAGKAGKRTLSRRSIFRWKTARDTSGNAAVAPSVKQSDTSPDWSPFLLELWQRPQKPNLAECHRDLKDLLPPNIEYPSYDKVRRFMLRFSSYDKERGRNTGSALAQHGFHHTRDSSGLWPMTEVHADGWGTHFTAPHPRSGKYVKLEVWHFHDVATRRVFPPSIEETENFIVIADGLRRCIAAGGVPAVLQTDCTGSVKNDRFEFDPVTSIAARCGTTIVHTRPGNARANGIAENFNKYLDEKSKRIATYSGQGMDKLTAKRVLLFTQKMVKDKTTIAERKALKDEAEKISKGILFESFGQACDWLRSVCEDYNNRPHQSLPRITDPSTGKRRHQTPNEAWQLALQEGWQPMTVTDDELIDLFRPHERKKVIGGAIRLYGQRYHHADLEHWSNREVMVAYDVMDGSKVWVKNLEGQLICEAAFYESRSYRMQSFYEMALDKRVDAAQKRLQAKADAVEATRPCNVLEQQPGLTDEEQALADAKFQELQDTTLDPEPDAELVQFPGNYQRPMFGTDAEKYQWLQSHQDQIADEDRGWMGWYTSTSEYQLMFGSEADNDDFEPDTDR